SDHRRLPSFPTRRSSDLACVHLGLNVANDVFDTTSGADRANVTPTQFSGGSRVILYGLLSLRQMVGLMVAFYAVGVGIGLYLARSEEHTSELQSRENLVC